MKLFRILSAALLATSAIMLCGADAGPQNVSVNDIGSKYLLIGKLDKPLGTFMTLEGITLEPGMSSGRLSIEKIDGKKLDAPREMVLRLSYTPAKGVHLEVRGYENCGLEGTPADPLTINAREVQSPLHFANWFQVTNVTPAAELEKRQ